MILARGCKLCPSAAASEAISSAAAPSLMPEAWPAVIVPLARTTGFSFARASMVVSARELERLCGVSRSGFATRFKDVLGVGPIEYLMRWRMAVAKVELRRGTRSISEIALAVGFQSPSAFSTSFTWALACSPKCLAGKAS
jgi:AraC-like DNA-binding protein